MLLAETAGLWFLNRVMSISPAQLSAGNWVYQCAIGVFVLSVLRIPFSAAIIAREDMRIYAFAGVLEVIAKLGIAFCIGLFHGCRLQYYSLMLLGLSVVMNGVFICYSRRHYRECRLSGH